MGRIGFEKGDLKQYPHFDAPLSVRKANELVTDPAQVAQNPFFPFICYTKKWQPFRKPRNGSEPKPDKKSRLIRYAARKDAYIFAHYRSLLAEKYEAKLSFLGIAECPTAYRRIPKGNRNGGKCNIDFAKDAFDAMLALGKGVFIAMDISKFFESLDHGRLNACPSSGNLEQKAA